MKKKNVAYQTNGDLRHCSSIFNIDNKCVQILSGLRQDLLLLPTQKKIIKKIE